MYKHNKDDEANLTTANQHKYVACDVGLEHRGEMQLLLAFVLVSN